MYSKEHANFEGTIWKPPCTPKHQHIQAARYPPGFARFSPLVSTTFQHDSEMPIIIKWKKDWLFQSLYVIIQNKSLQCCFMPQTNYGISSCQYFRNITKKSTIKIFQVTPPPQKRGKAFRKLHSQSSQYYYRYFINKFTFESKI